MNGIPAEYFGEVFKQLASIGAVLGGLAFTAAAALLAASAGTSDPDALDRSAKITAVTAVASAVCLIISATTWSLSYTEATLAAGSNKSVPSVIFGLHSIASLVFVLGILLLFVSVGASGWIGSRKLGIVTSIIAAIGGVSILYVFSYFQYIGS